MTQPIALLAGGTKILERALQTTLPAELAIVATIEEAAKVMGERPVGLVVLGPTLRRALAMVATLRREGQTWPRLLVVYRDDQRDEVKRHQRGKVVADGYVALSRIAKDLAPVATEQWQAAVGAGAAGAAPSAAEPGATGVGSAEEDDDGLEEIPVESIELQDVISQEMDVLPPLQGSASPAAAPAALAVETTMEIDAIEIFEEAAMEEASLEELPAASVADAGEELIEDEIVAEELIEEIPSDELISENVTHAAVAAVHAVDSPPAEEVMDGDDVEEIGEDDVMMEDAPAAASEPVAVASPVAVAAPVGVVEPVAVREAVAAPEPVVAVPAPAETRASRPQSGAFAALGDLSGFIERLQEASAHVDRLEVENDALRHDVARLQRSARPELEADLQQAQSRAQELAVRLDGAERARDMAVEARMKAEQREQAQQAEIARLRADVEAGRNRETGLEAQLDAKSRIAQDAARSLRGVSQLLDG